MRTSWITHSAAVCAIFGNAGVALAASPATSSPCRELYESGDIQTRSDLVKVSRDADASAGNLLSTSMPRLFWDVEETPEATLPLSCLRLDFKADTKGIVLFGSQVLKPDPSDGGYHFYVPWAGEPKVLLLSQLDDFGELKASQFNIQGVPIAEFQTLVRPPELQGDAQDSSKKAFTSTAQAGLQMGQLDYKQTRLSGGYNATVATLKAGYDLSLDSEGRWNLGVTGYATLAHLSQSLDDSPRFLGGNLRVSYRLPVEFKNSWKPKFRLAAGLYFLTVANPDGNFGFTNLSGPQLLPSVELRLPDRSILSMYLKFSPVSAGFQIISLDNRELAVGLQWSPRWNWARSLSLGFDFSQLNVRIEDEDIDLQSMQLGVSYRFL